MSDLSIRTVSSEAELQAFLRMPWEVYKDDPNWCPPLWAEHVHFFDPAHNMELRHIDFEKFVAWRGDKPVGTIIAFINHAYNDFQKQNAGWFGQFEVLDDREAAHALLKTTEEWVGAKGVDKLMGPATYSTNSEIGLLVEGHEYPQMLMTSHARPYIQGMVESYGGFQKAMDLWCWYDEGIKWGGTKADKPPEKLARIADKIRKHRKLTLRQVDMRHFLEEVQKVKVIYNQAWAQNWGFVPLNDEEIDHLAAGLKDMVDPHVALFVEVDGKTVGFGLPLPDVYEPLRKAYCRPGEPNWWQLARLIWHWKIAGKVTGIRVWALGVLEEYRGLGVDAVLYYEMLKRGLPRGYSRIEMGWVLENNEAMNAIPQMVGSRAYKTYRVYEKMLTKS
jgi:GNAT superfamily N-acetyltransferase